MHRGVLNSGSVPIEWFNCIPLCWWHVAPFSLLHCRKTASRVCVCLQHYTVSLHLYPAIPRMCTLPSFMRELTRLQYSILCPDAIPVYHFKKTLGGGGGVEVASLSDPITRCYRKFVPIIAAREASVTLSLNWFPNSGTVGTRSIERHLSNVSKGFC